MGLERKEANITVVQATEKRIKNIFDNGLPVYLAFSGGKDTLCMADITLQMIKRGEIDPEQLTCIFIDEEAIFPCVERIVKEWRMKFLEVGARFDWYCIEVRHYSCFNMLENDESFICWDRNKKDAWVRQPPPFAIRSHPKLRPRRDTYQEFLSRATANGINMIGVRVAESVQRLLYFSQISSTGKSVTGDGNAFPTYDWKDDDVWLYLLENNINIPDAYMFLWQAGRTRKEMRISQFFSVDTAGVLVKMGEFYPDLMDKVIKREPNAYLAALYWDSEMFRRNTRNRRELEQGQEQEQDRQKQQGQVDYRKKLLELLSDINGHFDTPQKRKVARRYKKAVMFYHNIMRKEHWRQFYEALLAGDPKERAFRGIVSNIHNNRAKGVQDRRRKGEL